MINRILKIPMNLLTIPMNHFDYNTELNTILKIAQENEYNSKLITILKK